MQYLRSLIIQASSPNSLKIAEFFAAFRTFCYFSECSFAAALQKLDNIIGSSSILKVVRLCYPLIERRVYYGQKRMQP